MEQVIQGTQAGEPVGTMPSLTPEDLAPHFPQLEIIECLGRGGMGVVYKARQKSLNRLVALKLLAPERADDPSFAERFSREAQALAALNHPHIVAVHDFGEAGGFYYLLMEFVDGVNLRQLLQSRKLTPKEALSIVPPVCEALQCAHDHGIVHRDIKPENLLMDKAGLVKIADFGIARLVAGVRNELSDQTVNDTGMTVAFGTPDYAAPEQHESDTALDHRADIYSLGVVLYEMLTGERPAGKFEPPSRRVQMDIRIDEIVLRALEKTPERRFATADEFRVQVEAVASSANGTVSQPDSSRRVRFPFWVMRSAAAREIASHMNWEERRESGIRETMFALWNAATFFAPIFLAFTLMPGKPLGYFLAGLTLFIGLMALPVWRRMHVDFLCNTRWAREQGLTPRRLADRAASEPSPSLRVALMIILPMAILAGTNSIGGADAIYVFGGIAIVLMLASIAGLNLAKWSARIPLWGRVLIGLAIAAGVFLLLSDLRPDPRPVQSGDTDQDGIKKAF